MNSHDNNDILRADFEAWFSDDCKSPLAVERNSGGTYKLMQAQSAWIVWQAARRQHGSAAPAQSLVEAGALRQYRHNDGSKGFVFGYDKTITDHVFASLGHGSAAQAVGGDIAAGHFKPHPATREWQEVPRHTPGAVILYHAAGWPHAAAEQPAAAGNALTDEQIEEIAEGFYASPTTDAIYNVIGFGQAVASAAIAQHLRAAPQQGEGLTWDEAQRICDLPDVDEAIRGLIEDSTGDNAVCMVQAIAAHTRAAGQDGKDAARWRFWRQRFGFCSGPPDGIWRMSSQSVDAPRYYGNVWGEEFYEEVDAVTDAAMQQAASNQQEGAK